MSDKLKDVIANLRAIIISFKGDFPIINIQKDYLEAVGERVPLKSLGYINLRELFEKNPTEFRLVGDKVSVVQKSNSAHISSLVERQGKGRAVKNAKNVTRHRRPRNREGHGGFESSSHNSSRDASRPWRQTNGKNASNDKENSKLEVKADPVEKITLRKPRDVKQNTQNSVVVPPLLETTTNFKSVTKTIVNEKYTGPLNFVNEGLECLEPFKDVEDLAIGKGAQSRLLKKKYKMLQDIKSSEQNQNSSVESEPSEMYFDLDSVSSPILGPSKPESLPSPSDSVSSMETPFPEFMPPNLSSSRQKAQARIANIKSSMQSKLMQQEVNNNITNNFSFGSSANGAAAKSFGCSLPGLIGDLESVQKTKDAPFDAGTTRHGSKNERTSKPGKNGHSSAKVNSSSEYAKILEEMCKSRGFQKPTYKIIVREPKNEPKQCICKVSIENYLQMSSYPLETRDELSAKNIAAKKMIDYLNMDANFTISENVNSKEEEIIPRVMEIVSPTFGVWSDKLPILYKEKYNEDLRRDWLDVITKTNFFEIDNLDGTRFIVRKKTDINSSSFALPATIEKKQLAEPETPTLKELNFPDSQYWEVYITHVNTSGEIWCRLIGEAHSDEYDDMMTNLELKPPEKKASKPKIGRIYGIKVSAIWYRVKLTQLVNNTEGMVFYIDVGDKDVVDLTELYEPQEVFFSVAPQAIMLSLHELGSFADDDELTSIITGNLLGNTYIAEVLAASHETNNFENTGKTVRLWDTSTERDVNVNQLLLNNIIKNITPPSLPTNNEIKEVVVSSVNDNGDIHVQTNPKSIQHLKCLIFNKIKSLECKIRRMANDTIGTEIIHLTKCRKNDTFCRVQVIQIENPATVDVMYIDYGFVERIAISDLIHLEKSSILQAIPAQAVKVKPVNIKNFNASIITKLRDYLLDQNLLMKVVETCRGRTPSVEFFKRSPGDKTLYSVNQKIVSDPDLKNSDIPARSKPVVFGLEKVLPRNLPPPNLPDIGQHFEVFVTLASSPDLFIVQPVSSRMELMEMMNELQTICNGPNASSIDVKEFVVGELYAVRHPDGNWYRGCAQAVLGSCNYSIYMCDFGDCIMVTDDKLQRLPDKFRTIPYQAIRATLHGIPPENRDWTPVDCVNFHELVVEKYFVSTIKEIQRDEKNPNYVNLGLILTDTTKMEDIYIHKVLLEKKNEAFTFIKSLSIS